MVTKKEKLDKLGSVPLFSGLGQKDLEQILDRMKETFHVAGDHVIDEGRAGLGFHLILEGEASVIRNGRTAARLGPGEFFGEMALVDDGPRSATVVASTDLTAVVLSKWEFRPLLKDHPEMAWKLIEHLVARVREEQSGRDALVC
ncbi:MAG TPA: cyclic nucleotide-binding domain-containing protein [Acidimicrobiia bacterium]|nr:cyclic nucleotide-binding domain-containing protein [Acidimicrobiia bacterium]